MTREIKYRAWVAGKMWEVESLVFPVAPYYLRGRVNVGDGRLGFPLYTEEDRKKILAGEGEEGFGPFVMQYTGLKDKNGKEIFEGDIVLDEEGINKYRNDYQILPIGTEEGAEGRPCLCPGFPLQQRCTVYDLSGEVHKMVVIGNMYENPELEPYLYDKND